MCLCARSLTYTPHCCGSTICEYWRVIHPSHLDRDMSRSNPGLTVYGIEKRTVSGNNAIFFPDEVPALNPTVVRSAGGGVTAGTSGQPAHWAMVTDFTSTNVRPSSRCNWKSSRELAGPDLDRLTERERLWPDPDMCLSNLTSALTVLYGSSDGTCFRSSRACAILFANALWTPTCTFH